MRCDSVQPDPRCRSHAAVAAGYRASGAASSGYSGGTLIAAVLHDAAGTPRAEEFPATALTGHEVSARVLAAGLRQLVRIHASGTHYSSHKVYPMVPGIDGVVELADGHPAYVSWPRPPAEATLAALVDARQHLGDPRARWPSTSIQSRSRRSTSRGARRPTAAAAP